MKNSVNIAIIGLGQIGIYLYNELRSKKKEIERKTGKKIIIVAISAKNKNKKRKFQIQKNIFFKKPLQIFKDKKIDILFECIGLSDGISKKIVETALKNKIHVITPNKALIAKHGDSLAKLAEINKVNLEFEASVAGGIPILRTIKEGLATNKINKVYGILNGTTNYILSEMESSNENFKKVLQKAQQLGYAEPGNPKLDLNGFDAFAKVRILSALSFNTQISKHNCIMEGIENIDLKDIKIASQLGLRVKLLGVSQIIKNRLFETVHPCLVSKNTYIGNVNGVMNAVIIEGKPIGQSVLQGEGAGPGPTSSSLLSDLLALAPSMNKRPFSESTLITEPDNGSAFLLPPCLFPPLDRSPRITFTVSPTLIVTFRTPSKRESGLSSRRRADSLLRFSCMGALKNAFLCFPGFILFTIKSPQTICFAFAAIRGQRSAASRETGPLISEP